MFSRSNLFSFSLISGNSMPYISCSKSGSVSGFLVLSHSFQNVQSCISNHSVPQITVSLVRQTAHNMHVACIASCIHVTKNSNNALTTAGFTPCLAHAILTFGGFVTLHCQLCHNHGSTERANQEERQVDVGQGLGRSTSQAEDLSHR